MSKTGNPAAVTPVLFYDFNDPPMDEGLYWCLNHPFIELNIGHRVRFGCASDEVMANGTITGFAQDGMLVSVQFESWVHELDHPESDSAK